MPDITPQHGDLVRLPDPPAFTAPGPPRRLEPEVELEVLYAELAKVRLQCGVLLIDLLAAQAQGRRLRRAWDSARAGRRAARAVLARTRKMHEAAVRVGEDEDAAHARTAAQLRTVTAERDEARRIAATLRAERDDLRTRLNHSVEEGVGQQRELGELDEAFDRLRAERDDALSELDKLRAPDQSATPDGEV
jgi:chromosome segregation ATPase